MIRFKQYLLPAIVFQSVIIAGGYGTGRELVSFFLIDGIGNGLISLFVVMTIWSLVCALTFEFARQMKAYDYRSFFHALLGRMWWLFEISYILVIILVLAVVSSAAGNILHELFGLNYYFGVLLLLTYVSIMAFQGSRRIENMLSFWSLMLYIVYISLFITVWYYFKPNIINNLQNFDINFNAISNGIKYAGYNLGLIPAVLFSVRHIKTQKQALTAGLLTGIIGILPAVAFYIIMLSDYPNILSATVPSTVILSKINIKLLTFAFNIILFGTFIESGIGLVHAFNERLANQALAINKEFTHFQRLLTAFLSISISCVCAHFGLVNLIERGYCFLTWVIITVYIIPLILRFCYKGTSYFFTMIRANSY